VSQHPIPPNRPPEPGLVRVDWGGWISGPMREPTLDEIAAAFPSWEIGRAPLDMYAAEQRSAGGRHIRYLVGRSLMELAQRLETAEQIAPSEPPDAGLAGPR